MSAAAPHCNIHRPDEGESGSGIQGHKSYPKRFPLANSDVASQSPWSRKLVLSLDGGGVRGYSSLLILEELLCIIADLEMGKRPDLLDESELETWRIYDSSAEYPWRAHSTVLTRRSLADHARAVSEASSDSNSATRNNTRKQSVGDTEKLKAKNLSGFRIHHYFDYVAGTSTGGLSALMLSRMRMGITEALQQYKVVGNGVFACPRSNMVSMGGVLRPRYSAQDMNKVVQQVVWLGLQKEATRRGKEITPNDIALKNENAMACNTAIIAYGGPKNKSRQTFVFRSYDRLSKEWNEMFNIGPASSARVWKVGRATSAAPKYFSEQRIGKNTYIDGGMGCNNPALVLVDEVKGVHGRRPELVISVGTGTDPKDDTPPQSDTASSVQQAQPVTAKERHKHRIFNNMRKLKNIGLQLPAIATDSRATHLALKQISFPKYSRFNVPGLAEMKLDEWQPSGQGDELNGEETLQKMRDETRAYLEKAEIKSDLERCAKALVCLRRRRAETERWEQYATHVSYSCPEEGDCTSLHFPYRDKLRMHASERHSIVPLVTMDDRPICNFDECAERPQAFSGAPSLATHLDGNPHFIENAKVWSTPQLEAWLDRGRTTIEAAFLERTSESPKPEMAMSQHAEAITNAGGTREHRNYLKLLTQRFRRDSSEERFASQ